MSKKIVGSLGLIAFIFFACTSKNGEENRSGSIEHQANDYPDLVLTFEDGQKLSTKNLQGNNVFIFFQPDCRHCQVEAINIEQRLDEFKNYTLYFISSGSMEAIMAFAGTFDLDNKTNVKFAAASTESVLNHYGPIQTPSVYIYSRGKLKKSFDGQTEIENILDAL